eukprot:scpid92988/ scgid26216/ 
MTSYPLRCYDSMIMMKRMILTSECMYHLNVFLLLSGILSWCVLGNNTKIKLKFTATCVAWHLAIHFQLHADLEKWKVLQQSNIDIVIPCHLRRGQKYYYSRPSL